MTTLTLTKTAPPERLLAFWKEIDDKTFGKGFDCFVEDATCRLGVAEWNGREQIRENLRAFIDTGSTAHHDVSEADSGDDFLGPTRQLVVSQLRTRGRDRDMCG